MKPASWFGILVALSLSVASADWPMWRCDSARSAATEAVLPDSLALLWKVDFGKRTQVWDDPLNLDLMTYDRLFEPIVVGDRMLVGFNDQDKLVALDTNTGDVVWTFFTDAPIRLAPAAAKGNVYFSSDDGCLYCVEIASGQLKWKFSGAPNSQKAIGNRRLVSAWPGRGGPVIRDDTVYFAASIWPFMGTFIYALDAESGKVNWVNDSTGAMYVPQPHSAPSFAGVAPQGALVATEDALIVPGGRSVPAVLDRKDGTLRYFEINAGGKGTGGSFVAADQTHFYVHTRLKGTRAFNIGSGLKTAFMPNEPVLASGLVYSFELDDKVPVVRCYSSEHKRLWQVEADGSSDLILVGNELVAAGGDSITFVRLPTDKMPATVSRSLKTDSAVERLLAANGKLFAVSLDGHIFAFAQADGKDSKLVRSKPPATKSSSTIEAASTAEEFNQEKLDAAATRLLSDNAEGYALWFGDSRGQLFHTIARRSPFVQLAMVDSDPKAVNQARRDLDAAGIYGKVTVHASDPATFLAPQYIANVVFVDEATIRGRVELLRYLYNSVRPFGGVLHVLSGAPNEDESRNELAENVIALQLDQARVEATSDRVAIYRDGPLPGSGDWTHQYGNVANTIKSDDSLVKLPLGILWFGGNSNMDVLPRHGHGPPEQVVGGRLFVQGINRLNARDVYTGRVLWQRDFDDLGGFDVYYDKTYEDTPLDTKYNQVHIPGANARGTNFVATEDRVYVVEGSVCHALDPATGKTLCDIEIPANEGGEREEWGYIGVYKNVLIGGAGFAKYRDREKLTFDDDKKLGGSKAGFGSKSLDRAASLGLIGFDRMTGKKLWQVEAKASFWHNGIVAGGGKIYCLDKHPKPIEDALRRRGRLSTSDYRIVALDAQTGQTQWEVKEGIFGTWLGYSPEHDMLLEAGASASDRLSVEVSEGMAVYHASNGSLNWRNDKLKYSGPCILHHDLIITNANSNKQSAGAFYITDGTQKLIPHPITGDEMPWTIQRAYGCNSIIASENLLTFRSGAASFYDLLTHSGTGNLGGFKSGCTSNLVAANGVLNAPDYTRTCSCAYQNQTSLALVHMPDVEMWSVSHLTGNLAIDDPIESLAINFGAPGDRRDSSGTMWLEYPVVGGASPEFEIKLDDDAKSFQHHSSTMQGAEANWIYSSGLRNLHRLKIHLTPGNTPTRYDVRLLFGAPAPLGDKKIVFDVLVQGEHRVESVTLVPGQDASAHSERLVKNVEVEGDLVIEFTKSVGSTLVSGIEVRRSELP